MNMQRFREGLVLGAYRLFASHNSRLEGNKEEEKRRGRKQASASSVLECQTHAERHPVLQKIIPVCIPEKRGFSPGRWSLYPNF